MTRFGLTPTIDIPHGLPIHGCSRCGGVWIAREVLSTIVEDATRRAYASDGSDARRRELARDTHTRAIVYRDCPICSHQMLRRNFARVSGIIIDECRAHGSYFDAGELEAVLAFVRSGGLALATEVRTREQVRSRSQSIRTPALGEPSRAGELISPFGLTLYNGYDPSQAFLSWALRWVRKLFSGSSSH